MYLRKKSKVPNGISEEEWRPIYDMIKLPPRPLVLPLEAVNAIKEGGPMTIIDIRDAAAEVFARIKAFQIRGILPVTALSPDAVRIEFQEALESCK